MPLAASRSRRRLAPKERKALILDHTAAMIAREGVAQLSVERIGKEAGISKSLVYAYFPNLTELLRELYQREMKRFRRLQAEAAATATTFEELVRSITHVYLTYMHERGLLIERLQSEPSVSQAHDPTEFSRDRAVDYLTEIVIHHFDLPRDIARAATDISFGLPASAGAYLQRGNLDLKTLEDLTVTMIIGTIVHVKDEYVVRRQPLRAPTS
ncbi:MAG: TetR family transcriptional regulator [Sphingomonas sp. 28-62-20]|uniref:TetR/AcrR family transcriptional regulator n=1 Tax=Sphingomonas sp. 28-62-20 TaxID=1970433 RepID=UPI000BCF3DC4|nr:MAG: TetR family transcriptional regulator [Sphingomonas sp. 28-62-20]